MLAAHLDVVAASTALDRWKYPPFEGHYDGVSTSLIESAILPSCFQLTSRNGSGDAAHQTASLTSWDSSLLSSTCSKAGSSPGALSSLPMDRTRKRVESTVRHALHFSSKSATAYMA